HPSISALLLAHRDGSLFQSDNDYIFCQPDGQPLPYQTCLDHLRIAMKKAEIKVEKGKYGFHIFRHSAGTLLYEKSRDLKLVQGTLRHSDVSTTSNIYAHLGDKVLGEGSQILTTEIIGPESQNEQSQHASESTTAFN